MTAVASSPETEESFQIVRYSSKKHLIFRENEVRSRQRAYNIQFISNSVMKGIKRLEKRIKEIMILRLHFIEGGALKLVNCILICIFLSYTFLKYICHELQCEYSIWTLCFYNKHFFAQWGEILSEVAILLFNSIIGTLQIERNTSTWK